MLKTSLCSQPDDMVASALKSFYSDPEVYYLVVDSISELVTIGKQHTKTNKQFVLDIWGIIHLFAKSLKSMNTSSKVYKNMVIKLYYYL
jgi:hypothetical protein